MNENSEEKSGLREVEQHLYSQRTDAIFSKGRHGLKPQEEKANIDWSDNDLQNESDFQFPYMKIFLGAFIFFILAGGFAFYRFFYSSNAISGDNIDILVQGPVSVAGGEVLPLDIEVKNKNNIDLKVVDLKIEYPSGTRKEDNLSMPLTRYNEILGDINVGKSVKRLVKAVLFGGENTEKTIKLTVEYRIAGSNAIFYKEKIYTILISSSPVNLSVIGLNEVNANQKIDFNVDITSNSLSLIKDLILKVDYPFGFNFDSANITPSSADESMWNIGDLEPGAKRSIKISGFLEGQDGDERVFKFSVGTPEKYNQNIIGAVFSEQSLPVMIKKPFIGVRLAISGDDSKEVSVPGGKVSVVSVDWQNNLTTQVYDVSIQVKLRGGILDKSSIIVQKGFYNSIDNTVIIDSRNNNSLVSILPGQGGGTNFNFASFSPQSSTGSSFFNPEIFMDVSVMGKRVAGAGVPQELLYTDSKRVKISSDLHLMAKSLRNIGAFENSGPVPPKAEEETTYTIVWTVTNIFNDISGAKVTGVLPPYVKWNALTSPLSEQIYYNPLNGEVTWDLGNVRSGTGFTLPSREVSFHVSIIPSLSQVGTSPDLLSESKITGTDSFSGVSLGEIRPKVSTDTLSDPMYNSDDGKVVK